MALSIGEVFGNEFNNLSFVNMLHERTEADAEIDPTTLFTNSPYYDNDGALELLRAKTDYFTILTLNSQSLNAKFLQLKAYVDFYKSHNIYFSAICLQETWLSDDADTSLLQLDDYNLIARGKRCSEHGGVAIYLLKHFNFTVLSVPDSNNFDGIFISISSPRMSKTVIVGNIYRPPRTNVDAMRSFTEDVTVLCNNFRIHNNVILVGDFNIDLLKLADNHHVCNYFETLISNSFIPKITFPTRLTTRSGTLIDNILTKLSDNFSDSTAGILLQNISDHLPCFISLDYLKTEHVKHKYVKLYTNSPQAMNELKIFLRDADIMGKLRGDPNQNYNTLIKIVSDAINLFLPVRTVKFNRYKHKKSRWITSGILKSIKFRDSLFRKLRSTPVTHESYEIKKLNLQTYNNILKKNIRLAKKMHYHHSFQNFKNDAKKTWSLIKDILGRNKNPQHFPQYFEVNGSTISNDIDISNAFNEKFVNIGRTLAEEITPPPNANYKDYLGDPFHSNIVFKQVSTMDIHKIINTLKDKNSVDHDRMSNKLIKFLKEELSGPLKLIINQSIEHSIFPDLMKIAKVTPLYKKDDVHKLINYRPISVLPVMSKIFERVLHNQLCEYFNRNDLLYSSQYGFRGKHSTELAALELIDRIILEMDHDEIPLSLFLDLSKAFDTIDHQILLDKLYFYGIKGNALQLIRSYLSNRYQYVKYKDAVSEALLITKGVPQGSILGPLLFIIYINDLASVSNHLHPIIYADDTTLLANLSVFSTGLVDVNDELNKYSTWMKVNQLSLNSSKSKAMVFHMPQKKVRIPELFIDGKSIEFVSSFNFLGIFLDSNMSWKTHTNFISVKIAKVIGILNKLKHFLPTSVLFNIYNSLLLPHMNYGLLLWYKSTSRIFILQKKAIRAIACSNYNAHTSKLFRDLRLLKLDDLYKLKILKFIYKLENGHLPYYYYSDIFVKKFSIYPNILRQINNYHIPRINHEFAKSTVRYKVPLLFNTMEDSLKSKIYTHSIDGFRLYIKNSIIQNYQVLCLIPNCYICSLER